MERWPTTEEIANHLGLSPITIYRWIEKGNIPSHRVGKFWRFKASEVDHWIAEGNASIGRKDRKNTARTATKT